MCSTHRVGRTDVTDDGEEILPKVSTHRIETFGNISSPFCTLAIFDLSAKFYGDRPKGTPPSGALNARGVAAFRTGRRCLVYSVRFTQCVVGVAEWLSTSRLNQDKTPVVIWLGSRQKVDKITARDMNVQITVSSLLVSLLMLINVS